LKEVTGKTPLPNETIRIRADRGDARLRLDQIVVRRVRDISRLSRTVAQQWIAAGAVRVDGAVIRRPSASVREGAAIDVCIPPTATRRAVPQPESSALQILFEDASFVAIDKPAGVVVHPSYKQTSGTMLNALLWHVRDRRDAQPGILTRLDKDTSGVVLVALSPDVHATMQRDASAGAIRKEYLAIVSGRPRPRAGTIDAPLGRDPVDRRRVMVTSNGAASRTRYEVLVEHESAALVRCELVTGRTHQIRVHLASRGWPVIGDALYGTRDARIARQALHAWRVTLPHPIAREPLTLAAPLPADMRAASEAAGLELRFREQSGNA
jgi:23S rRNA pseudouridine1911/1915/1917 synthase